MQMIPMITKEKLVQTIRTNKALLRETIEAIIYYLELPTPSLNPMKIDEEMMATCFEEVFTKDIYAKSNFKTIVDKYNSTLEDHQVLQPLPENPPDWFNKMFNWASSEDSRKIWSEIINHYGTPTKKELVSVEELEKELFQIYGNHKLACSVTFSMAKHIIDTYSLNPPKREWWMDLKEGDKFIGSDGRVCTFNGNHIVESSNNGNYYLNRCTPYIEPSIHDKVKEKLGNELYEEFMKEVKG